MFFDQPMILQSKQADGRHWLTTLDVPPLQIWPVAPNHCRVGQFLARLISAKLASLKSGVPEEMTLTRDDVTGLKALARYAELKAGEAEVRVRLVMMNGPADAVTELEEDEDSKFVTPQPPLGWESDYDTWIMTIGRNLGVAVPTADCENEFERAMAGAAAEVQRRLPSIRERFVAGMQGLNLGLKVGLTTRQGDKEYVWVRPTDWQDENALVCVLESQPRACEGYKRGQTLNLAMGELFDYAIGSEAGLIDPGLTQRIAEDYGLVIG
ncbi:MAG: hypothetical protein JWO95_981 [Verrucomicrobiales bacterium]|nr:hypothetical protein [Verrucomicrobiales bacterium]